MELRTTLICMAYGLGLWLVMGGIVAAVWYGIVKVAERRRHTRFIRAWNEWMEFSK